MTLVEIQNQIIGQLVDKDIVTKEELVHSIKIPKENEAILPELINAALKNLEDTGIVNKIGDVNLNWILRQPLKSMGQTIDLSMETCNEIADVINSFLDANDMKNMRADKLNISEAEIVMLINIINEIASNDPPS